MGSKLSMATRVFPVKETCEIQPEDHQMLRTALEHWNDKETFTDERVMQVKNLFKRIFSLPEGVQLVGGALPDAIVLSPIGDQHTFYVLMRPEDPEDQGWEAKELVSEGTFMWTYGTPFRTVMYFLSQSSGGLLQGDSDHEVLMPFPEIQEKSEVTSQSKNPEVMSLSEISEVTSRYEISEVTSRYEISEVTSLSEISEVTS